MNVQQSVAGWCFVDEDDDDDQCDEVIKAYFLVLCQKGKGPLSKIRNFNITA